VSLTASEGFSFTTKEREYLIYIFEYSRLRGMSPAFTELQTYFKVSPPTVNQMLKNLANKGYIDKQPGVARSISINVPANLLLLPSEPPSTSYTKKQGQYLAIIHQYTKMRGFPPSYAELEHYFGVTAPTVNQMIKTLHSKGLIEKEPRKARSMKVTLPAEQLPPI
jgi:Mn-dependent DtxR family transcriptional regulator